MRGESGRRSRGAARAIAVHAPGRRVTRERPKGARPCPASDMPAKTQRMCGSPGCKKVDHHPFRKSLSSDAKRAIGALLVAAPHSRCLAAAAAPMWQTVASMARQARQAEVVETREAKYIPP